MTNHDIMASRLRKLLHSQPNMYTLFCIQPTMYTLQALCCTQAVVDQQEVPAGCIL
jgi:hypothetical protein